MAALIIKIVKCFILYGIIIVWRRYLKDFSIYLFTYLRYLFFKLNKNGKAEIITIIDGGLGSQMSQYAMGQEIQRITGVQVSYDLSWYDRYGKDINGKKNRFFELDKVFPAITVRKAISKKCLLYRKLFNKYRSERLTNNLDEIDLSKPPIYLRGYWKTSKYSNYNIDSIRKMFTFDLKLDDKNTYYFNEIRSCNCSVAIQIRLGDYLGSILNIINQGYFYDAIDYLITKITKVNTPPGCPKTQKITTPTCHYERYRYSIKVGSRHHRHGGLDGC
jgi:hypothetical protein